MSKLIKVISICGVLVFYCNISHASIVWHLNDFSFDTQEVSGSFTWDETSLSVTSFNLNTSNLAGFPSELDSTSTIARTNPVSNRITFGPTSFHINVELTDILELSTPGSSLNVLSYSAARVDTRLFSLSCSYCYTSSGDSGAFVSSVVPVPAAVWLMGTSLLGLVGFSHNRITQVNENTGT